MCEILLTALKLGWIQNLSECAVKIQVCGTDLSERKKKKVLNKCVCFGAGKW